MSQKRLRQYSLVKFDYKSFDKKFHKLYPFVENRPYIFLGEIPNMPEHCIVIDHQSGQIHSGFHTEDFVELTEDEL